jgi:beta-phosphoglucomutase-like phosphatase (HAD superfamily)
VPTGFQAAIFDVDGVVVDSPHERAWRDALAELMETGWRSIRDQTSYAPERFTPQLYHEKMSGKPTMSGARAALEYFDVPDVPDRIEPYGERKQRIVDEILAAEGVTAYPDALRFVLAVRDAGILVGAASSSKNAGRLLAQIRLDAFAEEQGLRYDFVRPELSLLEFFDADVSGRDFAHGKPDPEIFLTAAADLRARPGACFVVEDAVSGIQAAKAGGMSALGVARAVDVDVLTAAHADLVVTSLDDVDLSALSERRLATMRKPSAASGAQAGRRSAGSGA